MWPNPQETAQLVTVTEEILNGKLHFLCIDSMRLYAGQTVEKAREFDIGCIRWGERGIGDSTVNLLRGSGIPPETMASHVIQEVLSDALLENFIPNN